MEKLTRKEAILLWTVVDGLEPLINSGGKDQEIKSGYYPGGSRKGTIKMLQTIARKATTDSN